MPIGETSTRTPAASGTATAHAPKATQAASLMKLRRSVGGMSGSDMCETAAEGGWKANVFAFRSDRLEGLRQRYGVGRVEFGAGVEIDFRDSFTMCREGAAEDFQRHAAGLGQPDHACGGAAPGL